MAFAPFDLLPAIVAARLGPGGFSGLDRLTIDNPRTRGRLFASLNPHFLPQLQFITTLLGAGLS